MTPLLTERQKGDHQWSDQSQPVVIREQPSVSSNQQPPNPPKKQFLWYHTSLFILQEMVTIGLVRLCKRTTL